MTVIEILIEGFKFFRDKKLSTNAMKDFVKSTKELNDLLKSETFYEMDSIKKLQRYVLHVIIEYITLDPRFDHVRTYHFVLLNHFHHGRKNYFPYYLLTSMSKAMSSFKKKPVVNPTLHEGLLLLIHEHFKAQTTRNNPSQAGDDDNGSSRYSSILDEIQSISSKGRDHFFWKENYQS